MDRIAANSIFLACIFVELHLIYQAFLEISATEREVFRKGLLNRMRLPSEKGPDPANQVQIKKKEENERQLAYLVLVLGRRELRTLVIL